MEYVCFQVVKVDSCTRKKCVEDHDEDGKPEFEIIKTTCEDNCPSGCVSLSHLYFIYFSQTSIGSVERILQ